MFQAKLCFVIYYDVLSAINFAFHVSLIVDVHAALHIAQTSDGSADKIGFGTSSPTSAFVTMDQASSTGAIAVLTLDQGDADQEFIRFDGTSGSDGSKSISSSTATDGSKVGAIRININGTDRFIRIYDSAI